MTVTLLLFLVTSKVRDYNGQNSNYIIVTDPSDATLLHFKKGLCFCPQMSHDDETYVHESVYIFLQEAYLI